MDGENIDLSSYIASIEILFDCSGICDYHPIYVFSNSRKGPPESKVSCFETALV